VSGELAGKVALVTGASRGIGQAIAVALAKAGAEVVCTSTKAGGCSDTLAAIAAAGGKGSAQVCDVGVAEQVEALSKAVLDQHGRLDLLVNNAGITKDGLFLRMSAADFDSVVATNLRGTFLVCKAFARAMAKSRGGRIVNIGSVVGISGNAGQANYAASKAGLIGLTKSLARELASRNITVNAVAPGFIVTDMTGVLSDEVKKAILAKIPLGKFGEGEDIAAAVAFLAAPEAKFITGQVLTVDGGMVM
jgi:3-oxoacyl-[acyl-carrier protein] reductase